MIEKSNYHKCNPVQLETVHTWATMHIKKQRRRSKALKLLMLAAIVTCLYALVSCGDAEHYEAEKKCIAYNSSYTTKYIDGHGYMCCDVEHDFCIKI